MGQPIRVTAAYRWRTAGLSTAGYAVGLAIVGLAIGGGALAISQGVTDAAAAKAAGSATELQPTTITPRTGSRNPVER